MHTLPIYLSKPDDLVSLPDVYFKVRDLIKTNTAGARELAEVISLDPALTTRFLTIANSAMFSPRSEISTVSRAVTLLGTQLVHDVVLSASVGDLFGGIPKKLIDVRTFWRNSVAYGVVAKSIAENAGVLDSGHLFTEGLLSDIGHAIMYQYETESMSRVLQSAESSDEMLHEIERSELGYDYCDVGGYLATQWDLPEGICKVLECHQEPNDADRHELEVAIVHCARRLVDADAAAGLPVIESDALVLIGKSVEELEALFTEVKGLVDETVATFSNVDRAA